MASHGAGRDEEDEQECSKREAKPIPKAPLDVDILEKGEIFFFYRPKVDTEHPTSIDEVARLYMVLKPEHAKQKVEIKQSHQYGKKSVLKEEEASPDVKPERGKKLEVKQSDEYGKKSAMEEEEASPDVKGEDEVKTAQEDISNRSRGKKKQGKNQSGDEKHDVDDKAKVGGRGEEVVNIEKQDLFRFIILGRKSLPDPSKRTHRGSDWGFVELVTTNIEDIKKALGPEEYETVTRGQRHKPAARAAGEGVYCILKHTKGKQSHTHLVYTLELPRKEKPGSPQAEMHIEKEASFIIQVKNPSQPSPPNVGLGNKRKATYPAHLQSRMGHYRFVSADLPDFFNYEGCEFILIAASDNPEKELGLHLDVEHNEECSALLSLLRKRLTLNVKPLLEGKWA